MTSTARCYWQKIYL